MSNREPPAERPPATALLIKWADMAARSRLEAAIRPLRLSAGQVLVLTTLDRLGQAAPSALSRELHLTPQAMTTLLKPLADRGLIARDADPANGRRVALSLTPDGHALLAQVRHVTPGVDAGLTAPLSEAERAQFRDYLRRIAGIDRR